MDNQAPPTPATAATTDRKEFKRIPYSVPRRKMEVTEIPGFVCYWFLEENVPRAMQGGYVFVEPEEVAIDSKIPGTMATASGNTDLGSKISIIGNKAGANGMPERQYLMKIRQEWYDEDQAEIQGKNNALLAGIFRDEKIAGDKENKGDTSLRYVDKDRTGVAAPQRKPLFHRPVRKA